MPVCRLEDPAKYISCPQLYADEPPPTAKPAAPSFSANSSTKRKVNGFCCCQLKSEHLLKEERKYYKSLVFQNEKVAHLNQQLHDMRERIRSAREIFLRQAIDLCKELNRPDEVDELIHELRSLFEDCIDRFHEKNLPHEANRLQGELNELNHQLSLGQALFDIKGFFEHLKSKLHKKSVDKGALNQVYRVHKRFGHESLPGEFKRSSTSKSYDPDDTEVNSAYEINEESMNYSKEVKGFDYAVEFDHPSIFSVGSDQDNAFYTPHDDQIVIGKGAGLFTNLASGPAAASVVVHEKRHREIAVIAGSALNNRITGLGYQCKGTDESGCINEALADIESMLQAVERLSKERKITILPGDPQAAKCLKVGPGIYLVGTLEDALRDPETGIGHTSKSVIAVVGQAKEKFFLRYSDSHVSATDPTIFNKYLSYLGKGDTSSIEVHWGSALYLKVFMNLVKELGHHVTAANISLIWDEVCRNLPYNPNGILFANTFIGVGRRWRNEPEYSLGGIDLELSARKSVVLQEFPV